MSLIVVIVANNYLFSTDVYITLCFFVALAPKLIIYDNACNLQEYCLNRDPGFFANTKFCVDKFHWYNHKGKFCLEILIF